VAVLALVYGSEGERVHAVQARMCAVDACYLPTSILCVCVCVCVRAQGTELVWGKTQWRCWLWFTEVREKECMLCKHGCVLWMHVICPQAFCVCVCVCVCVRACSRDGTGVGKDTVAVLALVYGSEGERVHNVQARMCVVDACLLPTSVLCVCVCVCACMLKGRNWCAETHSDLQGEGGGACGQGEEQEAGAADDKYARREWGRDLSGMLMEVARVVGLGWGKHGGRSVCGIDVGGGVGGGGGMGGKGWT